jgi:chemotaxis-related protein WspD
MSQASCWTTIGVWGRDEPRCAELERVVHCRNCEVFARAARSLLDREPPPGHGGEAAVTAPVHADQRRAEPALVFRLGEEYLALGVEWVTEVVVGRPIRTIPHRPDELLLGIANVSGELRLCVSLEVLLGQAPPAVRGATHSGRLLTIGRGKVEWAVPVDQALAIHQLPLADLETPPATVERSAHAFLRGMFPWRGHRVGLLDGDLVLGAMALRIP